MKSISFDANIEMLRQIKRIKWQSVDGAYQKITTERLKKVEEDFIDLQDTY